MLEDGRTFRGRSCGAQGTVTGEVCFNTSMTGYSEILTDPSYHGQIVCLTTAEVGVYGVASEDAESNRIQVAGFVVRHMSYRPSNWRSSVSLPDWLRTNSIVAIEGIDTRALTRHLRGRGAMRGVLTTDTSLSETALLELARTSEGVLGQNFTTSVSRESTGDWSDSRDIPRWYDLTRIPLNSEHSGLHIVVCDYGAKSNIPAQLSARGCKVTVVPVDTPAEEIMALQPDGVLLSNGPGDPAACVEVVQELRKVIENVPTGGICLGHQLLALACGAKTEKLPFGHRGANHPVKVLDTGKVLITSQNHGFSVRADTLGKANLELTHLSLNDGTVEGFRHRKLPIMSVQYHPEAAPGPHDAHDDFFESFLNMVESGKVAG